MDVAALCWRSAVTPLSPPTPPPRRTTSPSPPPSARRRRMRLRFCFAFSGSHSNLTPDWLSDEQEAEPRADSQIAADDSDDDESCGHGAVVHQVLVRDRAAPVTGVSSWLPDWPTHNHMAVAADSASQVLQITLCSNPHPCPHDAVQQSSLTRGDCD